MVKHEKALGHFLESEGNRDLSQSSVKQMHSLIRQKMKEKQEEIARKEALIQHVYSFDRCRQIAEGQL